MHLMQINNFSNSSTHKNRVLLTIKNYFKTQGIYLHFIKDQNK